MDCLNVRLVAKGYTQINGFDYYHTFSFVARMASIHLLLSMAATRSWPLFQLDIKNAFLHGNLANKVYIKQQPSFVTQGGVWFGMQAMLFLIWPKAIPLSLV